MKPYVVCHMASSLDGRINPDRWRPEGAIDGASGAPTVFDSQEALSAMPAPIQSLSLEKCQLMESGIVWLRYRLKVA